MTRLKHIPSESKSQSVASNVALFEALCTEKRALGVQIEKDILQLDQSALEDVYTAELELERAKIECSAVTMYLDRAYEGLLPSHKKSTGEAISGYNGFPSSVFSTPIDHSNAIMTDSLASLPPSSFSLSAASAVSDTRTFSVTSEIIRMIEEDTATDNINCDSFESDSFGHFSLSVERHKLLCQALQKLDRKINDEVEHLVLNASRNVSNAKERLEENRKEAAETVKGLKQASGSAISIQLPWASSGGDYTMLVQDHVSMVTDDVSLDSPAITSVGATFPPSPTPPVIALDIPGHMTSLSVNDGRTSPNNVSVSTPSTSFIYPNEDVFPRYEDMVTSITTEGSRGLWPWDIPWPILTLSTQNYPPTTCDPLMASDTLDDNLEVFVTFYARWKGQPLRQARSAMLLDWTAIIDRIPAWMREEKAKAETIISCLSHLC